MMVQNRPDTDAVIANISQVADSLTEQVAQLRQFVRVLQQEYEHPETPSEPPLYSVEEEHG